MPNLTSSGGNNYPQVRKIINQALNGHMKNSQKLRRISKWKGEPIHKLKQQAIKILFMEGMKQNEIAIIFDLDKTTVSKIICGKTSGNRI